MSKSQVFAAPVGRSVAAESFSKTDYLIDTNRFASEGNWAFCRFANDEVPAARVGFQRGGFNGGSAERAPSPQYLQLHLELMTREGGILWLPSGVYPAGKVRTSPDTMDIELQISGRKIFSFRGWPKIECHFCSADGTAQADLLFELAAVTVLPDCILPHCLFGMWECMGDVSGSVRSGDHTTQVNGKVFFDHTRIFAARHAVVARKMYVYTTLYFDDGSGLFGYYCVDAQGRPIAEYCFGVHLDATGASRFFTDATLTHLSLDSDCIASGWQLDWRNGEFSLSAEIRVQPSRILKSWGTADAPQQRAHFSIIPLVLNASCEIADGEKRRTLHGRGLAEYFNADLWPADAAAAATTKLMPE